MPDKRHHKRTPGRRAHRAQPAGLARALPSPAPGRDGWESWLGQPVGAGSKASSFLSHQLPVSNFCRNFSAFICVASMVIGLGSV